MEALSKEKYIDRLDFIGYCIEIYKEAKSMNGADVYRLFEKYGALDYIYKYYEALHITGERYTIDDIDEFILKRK
ncbi:MAG: DUF3791 domain-containing protein [Clostridiaceae bacterium]|jgi:hypothetical protein|nr:DUF3791 domain-containing protein [Clostridiaceae bacterium]